MDEALAKAAKEHTIILDESPIVDASLTCALDAEHTERPQRQTATGLPTLGRNVNLLAAIDAWLCHAIDDEVVAAGGQ